MTRLPIVLAAVASVAATPVPSFAQTAEPAVRAGDSSMTCEMIIEELNIGAAAQAEAARRTEQRARAGRGFMNFARGALSVAGPMLAQGGLGGGLGGDMSSTVAQLALQQAQSAAQQQAMTAAMGALSAAPGEAVAPLAAASSQTPRQAHLTSLFSSRGC